MSSTRPGDGVPTPSWLMDLFAGWFDPYPLNGDFREPPAAVTRVWVNPGFSKKEDAIENAIRWHTEGKIVVLYLPIETSTQYAKRLLQYGCRRLYFEKRPYPNCRGIELIILTGGKE